MLTVREAANKLGFTVCRIRQLIHDKKLRAKVVDGRFKISESDLKSFIKARSKIRVCESVRKSKKGRLGKTDKRFKVIK